ncbi:MAG: hypothetical protein JO168_09455 [Solirubrobacterales bacterium]|nr:hypothetical protein [Solirubrobacterales bacterium]MBV9717391.1 hypothetical protein [Solirubrobacterales bacterium]
MSRTADETGLSGEHEQDRAQPEREPAARGSKSGERGHEAEREQGELVVFQVHLIVDGADPA